jgi:predicted TIM-barrel enzyme
MAGRGSLAGYLPYGDANAIVMEMAGEVLTVVERTPRCSPACAHRPVPADAALPAAGRGDRFAGVQNFPTVGIIDGVFRQNLEETG